MSWSIQVEGLSKRYKLGTGQRRRFDSYHQVIGDGLLAAAEKLTGGASRAILPARIPPPPIEIQSEHMVLADSQFQGAPKGEFWAIRDVSFRIDEGQRVGIVGKNGSGKSTLLKILSRITPPTEGRFSFRGRLISLLEIGTGFHPDLTGRENIFLNAKINGMSTRGVRRIFDEIVEFSELGVQVDTPIKRYSSGMYMRLAFSVAAHIQSEILVVDEVLAVGDAGFQKKCLDKMLQIGNSGRTLLFVSHDMDAIRKLCSSALELSHGKLVSHDAIRPVGQAPVSDLAIPSTYNGLQSVANVILDYSLDRKIRSSKAWDRSGEQPMTENIRVSRIWLSADTGEERECFQYGEDIHVCTLMELSSTASSCIVNLSISTPTGLSLVETSEQLHFQPVARQGLQRVECIINGSFFAPGIYQISMHIKDNGNDEGCKIINAIDFIVQDLETSPTDNGSAFIRPKFHWVIGRKNDG